MSVLRRPVAELAADVRAGRRSARELVGASLEAIETHDATLGAFVCVDIDRAMADAGAVDDAVARGDDPGPLAGIPLGVKDTEDALGFVTTQGSATRRELPPATSDSIELTVIRSSPLLVTWVVSGSPSQSSSIVTSAAASSAGSSARSSVCSSVWSAGRSAGSSRRFAGALGALAATGTGTVFTGT